MHLFFYCVLFLFLEPAEGALACYTLDFLDVVFIRFHSIPEAIPTVSAEKSEKRRGLRSGLFREG